MKHAIVADTQCKPGIPLDYMSAVGSYLAEKRPDVIVHIGDNYDFESLSSYDKGKKAFEGRRLKADIEAGNKGLELLLTPIWKLQQQQRRFKKKVYTPRLIFCTGNHEDRFDRLANDMPELDGFVGMDTLDIEKYGFEVYPFLKPIEVDGIFYVHYLANPFSGKPYGGTAMNILKTVGRSFVVGHKQTLDIAIRPSLDGKMQIGIVNGACLTPDHKILHSDLTYRELGDLKIGDSLVSFEENLDGGRRGRRFKTGKVLNVKKVIKPVFQVKLESGKIFKTTEDHQWVVKLGSSYQWRTTSSLRKGTRIPKFLDEWEEDKSFEAGYLSGIFDGEGCYYTRKVDYGVVGQLSFSQKKGLVLTQAKDYLIEVLGQGTTTSTDTRKSETVDAIRIKGGMREVVRTLGVLRPIRLLDKFKPEHIGRLTCDKGMLDTVESIIYLGDEEVVMTEIDEGTMIVEGYAHHNCYEHDEVYKGYQGNNHFRGITMLNEVSDGFGLPSFVSLDYMIKKYN